MICTLESQGLLIVSANKPQQKKPTHDSIILRGEVLFLESKQNHSSVNITYIHTQFGQEHVAQQLLCPRPATHWQHHRAEGRAEMVLKTHQLGNDEFLHYVIRFVWEPLKSHMQYL